MSEGRPHCLRELKLLWLIVRVQTVLFSDVLAMHSMLHVRDKICDIFGWCQFTWSEWWCNLHWTYTVLKVYVTSGLATCMSVHTRRGEGGEHVRNAPPSRIPNVHTQKTLHSLHTSC